MLLEKVQQEKFLKKSHLETAMDSVGLKHVTRDTVDDICKKITTSWPRTRREIKPSQTSAKRLQTADAADTQEKKKSKAGGAVADAPSNAVGLEQSDREATGRRVKIYLTFLQEKEMGRWQPPLLFLPQTNECWELGLQHQEKNWGQTECSALVE
jgi:hypothetical protein